MIRYLSASASLSQSSHRPALRDIDSSYLNGTFPFLRGLNSQPSRPSSHSVRGPSKHCQSACAAPSPPFSWLLVYLGSREWWWAPSGKIAEGLVDGKDVCGNGDRGCVRQCPQRYLHQQAHDATNRMAWILSWCLRTRSSVQRNEAALC